VIGLSDRWRTEGIGDARTALAAAPTVPRSPSGAAPRPCGLAPSETLTRFTRTLASPSGGSLEFEDGRIAVQTYRDYFDEYRLHPEAKALAADGKPCHQWTRGPLQPPRVHATRLARTGKEANPLADTADLILEYDERAVEYRELCCRECGNELRGRQRLWCSEKCRKRVFRAVFLPKVPA
jgi:hypothetical protein